MIQDIAPHVFYNPYKPQRRPRDCDLLVDYADGSFLLDVDQDTKSLNFPRVSDLPPEERGDLVFLFEIDEAAFFLRNPRGNPANSKELPCLAAYSRYPLREIRSLGLQPRHFVFALFTAYHLAEWYRAHRFCGYCGHPTCCDGQERALRCTGCGNVVYPRINPAVIVGVINGDRLLVTRYRRGFALSALIAGFTEIGETLEETVAREVMEEAGIRVRNIRYYKSQPWGIAEELLAGFYCDLEGDPSIRLDTAELKEAVWLSREEIQPQPQDYSLTNEMLCRFKSGQPC